MCMQWYYLRVALPIYQPLKTNKKNMKSIKVFISIITLTFFASITTAQEWTLTDEQKTKIKEHLKESFEILDLSEEQKLKFKEITKKYVLQMKTLKNSNQSKSKKIQEFKTIIEFKNKEMKELLSSEQYNVYEETQKERIKAMKENRI